MTTPLLGLDEVTATQQDKYLTVNTANRQSEARTIRVIDRDAGAVPGSPNEGDSYIVDTLTGAWSGFTLDDIASYIGGQWVNLTPFEGLRVWVNDEDTIVIYDGSAWTTLGASGALSDILITDNVTDAFRVRESTNEYININTTDASEAITFGNTTTNPTYEFAGANGVGIGAAPTSNKLTVNGNIALGDDSTAPLIQYVAANRSLVIKSDPTNIAGSSYIGFEVDGSEAARFDSNQDIIVNNGDVVPDTGVSQNLGSTSLRWNTVYATTFSDGSDILLNTSGTTVQHAVDSTWTAQEFYTSGASRFSIGSDVSMTNGTRLLILDGSAASPSLAFSADSNNGFYRAGVDNIGVSTNGNALAEFGTSSILFNQDLDFASGKGVIFDDETLDEYDEGTWTPVISDAVSGGNTATFTNNASSYTRVGRKVTINFDLSSINTAGMTAGNTLYVQGLPFVSNSGASGSLHGTVATDNITYSGNVTPRCSANTTVMAFIDSPSAGVGAFLLVSAFSSGSAGFGGSLTYYV